MQSVPSRRLRLRPTQHPLPRSAFHLRHPQPQPVKEQIHHRRRKQRQRLRHDLSRPTIVMPSGRRNSLPVPVPSASGKPAQQRRHRRHHDRPEPQQARFVDRLLRRSCRSSRSATSAKSIIMIAFFFTIPIRRIMPIIAMMLNSTLNSSSEDKRAYTRRRKRRENRQRMDKAFVQDAEHNINRHQRPAG